MKNKKWKKFEKLTEKCYDNMIGVEKDGSCWMQTFELLKEIILEERQENPDFASQLEMVDDVTDYEYDIQGWLEDCLDEIDMREQYDSLLEMCDDLLELFDWPDYTGSDIKFRKTIVLKELNRKEIAAEYCKVWMQKEPENIVAATAGVYALIGIQEYEAAEKLVSRFIFNRSECTEENDIMFTAASELYEVTGNKKEKKRIDKALEEYEEYLGNYFEELDSVDEELDFFDDLPF